MHRFPFKKDDEIAVLGAGVEGRCVVGFLQKHGFKNVTICDQNHDLVEDMQVSYIKGENAFDFLDQFDVIFRSPGIHKEIKGIAKARDKGSIITSATKLFFDLCPCEVIGVTGTKGKGTTSTLIHNILKSGNKDVYLGGNIGNCSLEFVDKLDKKSIVVLEMSSFQLHDLEISPHVAVVLNTTSEHLDYHKDLEEYLEAKGNIVRFQEEEDLMVTNKDYSSLERYIQISKAEKKYVSVNEPVKNGAFIRQNDVMFIEGEKEEFIIDKMHVGLMGPHNLENILPAITVGKYYNIPNDIIAREVENFKGLEHRLEVAGIHPEYPIKLVNDSFSTTPETCIAGINSFKDNLVLIAGGSEKHSDFTKLAEKINSPSNSNLKYLVLMGDTSERIAKEINKNKRPNLEIVFADNGEDAFGKSFELAKKLYLKDEKPVVVLLSPACASFGLFKNYKDRGNQFKEFCRDLIDLKNDGNNA